VVVVVSMAVVTVSVVVAKVSIVAVKGEGSVVSMPTSAPEI
jgi:hypothetical protein